MDEAAMQQIMEENEDLGMALHIQSLSQLQVKKGKEYEGTRYGYLFDNVAVIQLIGAIYPRANMMTMSGATNVQSLVNDVIKAYNDEDVTAIVLDIDSPGGDVRGIGDGANIIWEMVKDGQKPIEAYVSGYMASAAYYLGSPASKITSSRSGMPGSIGVVLGARKLPDGEYEIVSNISPYKRPDPSKSKERAILQQQVDDLGEIFAEDVENFRGITHEKLLSDYGQGAVVVAPRAKAQGMIDDIGTLGEVVERLASTTSKQSVPRKMARGKGAGAMASLNEHPEFAALLTFSEEEENSIMGLKELTARFKAANNTIFADAKAQEPATGKESENQPAAATVPGTIEAPAAQPAPAAAAAPAKPTREELEERYSAHAELFAERMTTDSRIYPSEQGYAAADLLTAMIDDNIIGGTVSFVNTEGEVVEGTREAQVRSRYASRPKHTLTEQAIAGIKEGQVDASVLAETEKEKIATSEIMTPERRRKLLASSELGQAVLAEETARA